VVNGRRGLTLTVARKIAAALGLPLGQVAETLSPGTRAEETLARRKRGVPH
jgi:hypothetical protein